MCLLARSPLVTTMITLGLETTWAAVVYHSAEVIEITGVGKIDAIPAAKR